MDEKELEKNLISLETEFSQVFSIIVDADRITAYKSDLLNKKLEILDFKFSNLCKKLDEIQDMQERQYKRRLLISLIYLIMAIISALISPPSSIIFIGWFFHSIVIAPSVMPTNKNNLKSIIKKISIIQENCERFLKSKSYKNDGLTQKRKVEQQMVLSLDLANKALGEFLQTGKQLEISETTKSILIDMLQSDLEIDEEDLDKLLQIAKEKVDSLNLELQETARKIVK